MSQTLIFWPAFAQVMLTIIVLLVMGQSRSASLKAKRKSLDDVAMNRPDDWDEQSTKVANNYKNQFEMPVLFFAAVATALAMKLVDPVLVMFAWVFVIARFSQTIIHIGPNKVAFRGLSFLVGVAALLAMWVMLAVRVAGV